ncbi:hypothetical protein [Hymenobacter frigidus]|uniref:hypothetical protein n=1 Tax=Hymenobacter frigidus TaxID=1524095 RepID=UPI00166AC1A2|nr:hypothetical protein [Hymenobacter frigidus]
MLRLDKTVTRKTTLHADQNAEDRAHWQKMSFAEKREVVEHLRHQAETLRALRELGRQQDFSRNAVDLTNSELSH